MIPRKNAAFIAYAKSYVEYLGSHLNAWRVPREAIFEPLQKTYQDAQATWDIHSNPISRNRESTRKKDETFSICRTAIALNHDYLRGNPHVPDEALAILGIRPRHPGDHEDITSPSESPVLNVERKGFFLFDAITKSPEEGQKRQTIRDRRINHGVTMRMAYIPVLEPIPDDDTKVAWQTPVKVTRTRIEINASGQTGMRLLVQTAWHNTRLQDGPWSEIFNIIVS